MSGIRHWIAHLLGWNSGMVVAEYDSKGRLWVAHQCECGKVSGAHITTRR